MGTISTTVSVSISIAISWKFVFLYRCDSSADYRSAMKRDISLTISLYLSLSQRSAAVVETGL